MTIQNPLFQPPSEWVCPEAIDYKGQSPVAIDLETYDPGIKDHGPGWAPAMVKLLVSPWRGRVSKVTGLSIMMHQVTTIKKFLKDNYKIY